MNAFPSIQTPDYPLDEDSDFPAVRTQFESGATQTRPRWTRSREAFTLRWGAMPAANLSTLKAFFVANQGASFTWTHPLSGTVYTVRFRNDSFGRKLVMRGFYQVELTLEEA